MNKVVVIFFDEDETSYMEVDPGVFTLTTENEFSTTKVGDIIGSTIDYDMNINIKCKQFSTYPPIRAFTIKKQKKESEKDFKKRQSELINKAVKL